ncbi:ROK family protein [Solirubrobacter phytolaccae]|uniref:ROK family protein n=1 Tax=Solirubrobacter phytolaccae TaxID=1404360 RepID=A0A9X3NHB2_9ACTN|nr:ROK family protein [Solirubrobacter phytolaccae]MDA0185379.1 ROK family protein [Solirubrobacter phytolaccae]
MLELIRNGTAVTRADMARHTGLARSTVSQRLEPLIARRLVHEIGSSSPTGGRPGTVLAFNPGAGVLLVADIEPTRSRLAVNDLAGLSLAEETVAFGSTRHPEELLEQLDHRFLALLKRVGRRLVDVRGVGVAVPGPVAEANGMAATSPHLPGWDGFPIRDWLSARYGVLTVVDKRANLMALGEHATYWAEAEHLLFLSAGREIACGIIAAGEVCRGAQGSAGEIGHLPIADGDGATCACGNLDCLEAVASTTAIATRLGVDDDEVVALARRPDADAVAAIREAGRRIGEALGTCVSFFEPAAIVVGGELARASQPLLAGIREQLARRSLPVGTDTIRIVSSRLGDRAALVGLTQLLTEQVLTPDEIDRSLRVA